MMFKIKEDNETISSLLTFLDRKVKDLRASGKLDKNDEIFKTLMNFYQKDIIYWMENFWLLQKDLDPILEQKLKDKMLDIISLIDIILENK